MPMTPTTQKALRLQSPGGIFQVDDVPIPVPGRGEILVKLHAVGLNPVDWKIQKQPQWRYVKDYPAVLGVDGAGTVERIGVGEGEGEEEGERVEGFEVGDRVVVQGCFPWANRSTTFQQYMIVPDGILAKLPPTISFDQAATIPLGLGTAAIALYNGAGYTPFWEEGGSTRYAGKPVLILGGSTSVGQYAIQLAKLSAFNPIITTASPHNAPLLHSLGATHFIDRALTLASSSMLAELAKITSESVELVFDTVSSAQTQEVGWEVLRAGEGKGDGEGCLIVVLPPVVGQGGSANASQGSTSNEGKKNPKIVLPKGNVHYPENADLGRAMYTRLGGWLEKGLIIPNRVEVLSGGLGGIMDGLERMSRDEVSGRKLVGRPLETD